MLARWGATDDEVQADMAGDGLIAGTAHSGTRAIEIKADSATVFDFLAQMGFGRAGWYSYDLLDNLGRKSATTINEDWLVRAAGERVPSGPITFVAAIVDRPGSYALQIPERRVLGYTIEFTLDYQINPLPTGVRLVSRARLNVTGRAGHVLSRALLWGDGVMVRRQLLGLKERCEATSYRQR